MPSRYEERRKNFLLFFILLTLIGWLIILMNMFGVFSWGQIQRKLGFLKAIFGETKKSKPEDIFLLERLELDKKWDALAIRKKEIEKKQKSIKEYEDKLKAKLNDLQKERDNIEKERELLKRQKQRFKDYRERIKKAAQIIVNMRPKQAVARLEQLSDLLVIDILLQIDRDAYERGENSNTPYYLSLMNKEKAARIMRKMSKVRDEIPKENLSGSVTNTAENIFE